MTPSEESNRKQERETRDDFTIGSDSIYDSASDSIYISASDSASDSTSDSASDSAPDSASDSASGSASGSASRAHLSIGSLVEGKYRLLDSLGEGGMGVVYKVEQVLLNRQMALKTLTGTEASEQSIKRFHSEAKLLAKLDHPGLVKVRDFGFIDNVKPFLVMDFVHGRTLSSVIKAAGVMPLDVSIKIFVELCFALGYAHGKNIVHRDIKPSNIMLTTPGLDSENEHVKVLDFGIAKLMHHGLNETAALTRTGEIFGSPFYMSPEQCLGGAVDHRSDIYSMGCVMFEVLTGAPPFAGETSLSTMMMHQSEKPLSLKEASLGRDFPQEIETLVASMLEKDPNNRIQSLLDVAQILIGIQKGLVSGSILNKPVSVPLSAEKIKAANKEASHVPKYLGYVICALLLGVFGMLALIYVNQQAPSPPQIEIAPDLPREKWCKISQDGRYKIFNFPKDYSIGHLSIEKRDDIRLPARGEVKVPVDAKLSFVPNSSFLAHPQFLRNFGPYDVSIIDFREAGITDNNQYKITPRVSMTDDELLYCNHLKGLQGLGLKNVNITDVGLEYIKDLPLKQLNVDGTDVTGKGLKKMRCLKNLIFLRACHLTEGDEILKALAGSTSIQDLAVTGSDVGDDDLKYLTTMPNLTELNIGYNMRITDKGLKYIAQLKKLQVISIDQTSVTAEPLLKVLKQLPLTKRPRVSQLGWTPAQIEALEKTWKPD
jgi:predicted Ser/Thr protein kinase